MDDLFSPFRERVRAQFSQLSPAQQQVARHLGDDPGCLPFGTVATLAAATGTSEATVVRLARALGYASFAEMQAHVRQMLAAGRTIGQYHTAAVQSLESEAEDSFARLVQADTENLWATVERNSYQVLKQATDFLVQSREIIVTGARSSFGVAHFFAFTLGNLWGNVTLLEPGSCHYHSHLGRLDSRSTLVAFAFPHYSRWTCDVLAVARAAGSTTVVITDSHLSRPGQLGDVVLEAVIRSRAATDSYVAALSLATALLSGAALRQPERVRANLTQLEEVYARWNVYVDD